MESHFCPKERMFAYMAELQSGRGAEGNTWAEKARSIQAKSRIAYPGMGSSQMALIMCSHFCLAITDPLMRLFVMTKNPRTVDQALAMIIEHESIRAMDATPVSVPEVKRRVRAIGDTGEESQLEILMAKVTDMAEDAEKDRTNRAAAEKTVVGLAEGKASLEVLTGKVESLEEEAEKSRTDRKAAEVKVVSPPEVKSKVDVLIEKVAGLVDTQNNRTSAGVRAISEPDARLSYEFLMEKITRLEAEAERHRS